MTAIQTYIDTYNRDGYVVVPDVFDPDRAAAALRDMENLFYGMSFEEYMAKSEKAGENAPLESAYGHQFPCGKDSLDCLIENDYFLDLMEALLGADQIRFRFGGLFLRSGPTDTVPGGFGIEHSWQGYHTDHHTACYLPHSQDSHFNCYLIAGAFLHDIEDDNAPMHIIPGSHKQIPGLIPRLIEEGIFSHWCAIKDIREIPEFAAPVPAKGKAGSVLLRSSYGVHAAVPFRNKRNRRATWGFTVSFRGIKRLDDTPYWRTRTRNRVHARLLGKDHAPRPVSFWLAHARTSVLYARNALPTCRLVSRNRSYPV